MVDTPGRVRADREVVEALCDKLVASFEEFAAALAAKDPEGLRFVDALMGCHNFYKTVILDLGRRTGEHDKMWVVAIATLEKSFDDDRRARRRR